MLATMVARSRSAPDSTDDEKRISRAVELADTLLTLCDGATRFGEAAAASGDLVSEPAIFARFLAGGGREEH